MKNILLLSVTFFCLILFNGCPYESSYPLGDMGKEEVNTDWEGKFTSAEISYVDITWDIPAVRYKIKGPASSGDASEDYIAYYTKIAGQEFLYVALNEPKKGKFYIYGIDSVPGNRDKFECREVPPEAFNNITITSTEELRKVVETKLKEGTLFGKLHVFTYQN